MSILNRTDMGWRLEGNARLKWLGGLVAAMIVSFCLAAPASAQTRSLKLYFIHTKEKAEITYMRNGRYDQRGLEQINRFLRDWRRNEPAKMDPKLLDVVWQVYQAVGARDYIHVVSAYRSPATNNMLRGRSSGVAENSQHTRGKAMDFYIPGVPLSKLRAAAFKIEGGGVGYYPKSGSPFVHLDVGNVRSWPRMSRNELMALFPDGRTIHVPTDGKPLPGYKQAMAAYKSRSGAPVQIASASAGGSSETPSRGLLSAIFGGGNNARPSETVRETPAAAPRVAAPATAPRREAPQPAAPVAQPAETIIAALPERSAPVPGAAPRPLIAVGAPAAAPLIAGLPERPVAPVAVDSTATALALNVPLPTPRPNYAPAAVAAPVQVAAAAPAPEANMPIAAIAAERGSGAGSTAIADMLAATAAETRADVVINNHPVPSFRPSLGAAGDLQVAALSDEQESGDVFVLAALPSTETRTESAELKAALRAEIPDVAAMTGERTAALTASPRRALIARGRADVTAALDSGVRTTAKSSKPRADQARPDPRAVAIPVQKELTRWAFVRDVDVKTAGGTVEPAKAHDIVWTAPKTVYTAGFQQQAPSADINRFSGKAVTFMSVARFN